MSRTSFNIAKELRQKRTSSCDEIFENEGIFSGKELHTVNFEFKKQASAEEQAEFKAKYSVEQYTTDFEENFLVQEVIYTDAAAREEQASAGMFAAEQAPVNEDTLALEEPAICEEHASDFA